MRNWPVERAKSVSELVISSNPITPLKQLIPKVILSSPAEHDTKSSGVITHSHSKRSLPAPDHVINTTTVEPSPSILMSRRGSLFDKGKQH
jgi:hypothetical protein